MATQRLPRYDCDLCEAQFSDVGNLRRHKMTKHEGVKYNCDQCDAEFSEQGNLKRHKLTKHDGIRYDCNQCEARFYDQNTLKKHQLTKHEGVKIDGEGNTRPTNSYSCQICGFKCGKKPNLKSHIKRRHCTDTLSIKELEEMYPEMYKCHDPNLPDDGKGTGTGMAHPQQQNPAGMKYPGMGGGLPQGNGGANHFAKQEQVELLYCSLAESTFDFAVGRVWRPGMGSGPTVTASIHTHGLFSNMIVLFQIHCDILN